MIRSFMFFATTMEQEGNKNVSLFYDARLKSFQASILILIKHIRRSNYPKSEHCNWFQTMEVLYCRSALHCSSEAVCEFCFCAIRKKLMTVQFYETTHLKQNKELIALVATWLPHHFNRSGGHFLSERCLPTKAGKPVVKLNKYLNTHSVL